MRTRRGFTLIEMIIALALVGIVGATFVAALSYTARSYLAAAESVEMAQKSRLALTRIFVELQEMRDVDTANRAGADADAFYYVDSAGAAASLVRTGGAITLSGNVLLDGVSASGDMLAYSRADGTAWDPSSDDFEDLYEIAVTVVMASTYLEGNRTFTTTINPLYTGVSRAPRLE